MNFLLLTFLSFVAVVSSHVEVTTVRSKCEEKNPNVFCADPVLTRLCKVEKFCKKYLRKSPCERGPEVYCKSKVDALACDKETKCMTWPDDSVVAVKMVQDKKPVVCVPSEAGHCLCVENGRISMYQAKYCLN